MTAIRLPVPHPLILLPAIGAAVVALLPDRRARRLVPRGRRRRRRPGHPGPGVAIAGRFKVGDGGYQMVSDHVWASNLGIHWSLGIDGISLFLVLSPPFCSPWPARGPGPPGPAVLRGLGLLLEAACMGSFVSLDLSSSSSSSS